MSGRTLATAGLVLLAGVAAAGTLVVLAGQQDGIRSTDLFAIRAGLYTAASQALASLADTIQTGRVRAPAVLVGLAAIVVVPGLALAMVALRGVRRSAVARQVRRSVSRRAAEAAVLPRLGNAWIVVDGRARSRLRLSGELVRIGRDEENDLRLEDPNVHRCHALIQRTADAEFVMVDVSGVRGNGVAVNGRRLSRARLRDGDLIELGNSRVRFCCEPIAHTVPP